MNVSEVMTADLVTVPRTLRVGDGLQIAHERKVHHLLLTDASRRLVGVVCICDLGTRPVFDPLASCISRPLEIIWPQSTLREAARRFVEKRVGCFPVCDDNQLVGIVTREDLRRGGANPVDLPGGFHCGFCGDTRHVRPLPNRPGLSACPDCYEPMVASLGGLYQRSAMTACRE